MGGKKKDDFLERGLTSKEAQGRLEEFGPNELKKAPGFSSLKLFLFQFKSPLVYVLLFAGLVTLFLHDFTDSLVIFAAVSINAVLGFYQEKKAQQSLAALRSLLSPHAKVIRDGERQIIEARQVVPGDLVVLEIGERVPADGVLVETTDLSLNEAILTGESMPVAKKLKDEVFMGTTVTTGIAKMEVVKTGIETQAGKIGERVVTVEEEKTPLQEQIASLAKLLAILVGFLSALIFLIGALLGQDLLEMFVTSVAIAVASIPEGLIVTLTVILALGMQRILKRQSLVRKLLAAETLGSVSVICADKTGTLTEGKLQVVKADFADQDLGVKAAILCNDLRDPLEVAMWDWAKQKTAPKPVQEKYPRIDEIPFSPKEKYIATLHPGLLIISGAPEVILARCKLLDVERRQWLEKFKEFGSKGYRLVGFAFKKSQRAKDAKIKREDLKDFEWLGILIYEDPIRLGVEASLKEAQKAGVTVKVITGDYASTAMAVLAKLKIRIDNHKLQVMEGKELEEISIKDLAIRVKEVILFARVDPEQKLKIVQALKDQGEVVAMMGDGVNDAPALKTADIGIVVGEASDVARETADMILLDSNFATIVAAIEEGRSIFENIKKVVLYLLSDSFAEVILIGGSLLLGLPLPVTAAQILWVNLVEDTLPGIALAFEPSEKEAMSEPPRHEKEPILDFELKVLIFIIGILTDVFLLGLFFWLLRGFLHLHFIQTVIFVALGIDSLFYVFACRSFRKTIFHKSILTNKPLILSVGIGLVLLLAAVYLPFLQTLLRTHPLGLREWAFLLGLGIFNLLAIEITKWVFLVRRKRV